MKKGVAIKIAIVVFAAVFLVSAYNIVKILVEDAAAKKLYADIESGYVTSPTDKESSMEENTQAEITEPAIQVDFTGLMQKNSEVTGWLYLPNSVINYPTVQARDNNKYLRRGLDGKYLRAGTLFADCRNKALGDNANYIIYGHNMKNGTMFATLVNYKKQDFYDKNPVIYYLTPEKTYKIELVSGNVVDNNADIYDPEMSADEFMNILRKYVKDSTFKSKVEIGESDRFITLSTCSYEYENARFIVIGRISKVEE